MTTARKRITLRRTVLLTALAFGAVALLLLGALLYRSLAGSGPSPIPESISERLTFSPFVIPDDTEDFTATSYKLGGENDDLPVFSYVIRSADGKHSITVSQYTQPAEYSDIPEYKTQFLSNIAKQYATVQTSNGTLYLGRQSKQGNKQLAIMLERGLLVFFAPTTGDVDEATWRKLGDALELQKI